jgi:hypothetical protein
MDQDRAGWGAQEYADALNEAATCRELFALASEVNARWSAAGDRLLRSAGDRGSTARTPLGQPVSS